MLMLRLADLRKVNRCGNTRTGDRCLCCGSKVDRDFRLAESASITGIFCEPLDSHVTCCVHGLSHPHV